MKRKVQRAEQRARRGREPATSDVEDDEAEDASLIVGRSVNVKKERSGRRPLEDIEVDD
jgi:hypothetical protein